MRLTFRTTFAIVTVLLVSPVYAQQLAVDALCAGATEVTGTASGVIDASSLRVSVNQSLDDEQDPARLTGDQFAIALRAPLVDGQFVRVTAGALRSETVEVQACQGGGEREGDGGEGDGVGDGQVASRGGRREQAAVVKEPPTNDDRRNLIASAYLGTAFDNFASSEVRSYLNQQDATGTAIRPIFGFDFEYGACVVDCWWYDVKTLRCSKLRREERS